jgi:ABC-2 type transport system ATP-binding protein
LTAISVAKLGRKYGESWGLKNATFQVKSGELAVLVGPNGAGKTTTVKILTTVLKPSKGKAEVLGLDVLKDHKKVRKRIAYLPQGFEPNLNLTPQEAVKWSLVSRGFSLRDAQLQTRKWIELMGLSDCKDRTGWTLSGGEKRKVAVAMVLATNADVIFLDEPTTGLDVEARHVTWKIIRESISEGATILLTTHNMEEAEILGDTTILINQGKTVIQKTPQSLVKSLPYQYRIAIKKDKAGRFSSYPHAIDLGDRLVVYAKSQKEVKRLISTFNDLTSILSVERVGLEDAYLHFIHGGNRMIEKLRQILGVAVLNGKWIQRQPLWIVQGFIMVLGLAITLFAWGSEAALRNLVVAYFIAGAWSLGLNIVAQIIGWDRVHLFYELYVASSITLPVYFVGAVLASMPFFLVNVTPAIALALLLQMDISFLGPTLLLSAVSILLGAFTSLSIILRLKKPTNISAITNPLNTLTIILPPVYYPLATLPSVWRELAIIMPTVSLMELGRWFAQIPITSSPVLLLVSLSSWLIIATFLVGKRLKWGLE